MTGGEEGGFPGVTVTAGSAAIIPRQFTGQPHAGPAMRSIGESTFGMTTGGQVFVGLTDTIGNTRLSTNSIAAQDIIMRRHPGLFILELVSGHDEGVTQVALFLPAANEQGAHTSCPAGTSETGAY